MMVFRNGRAVLLPLLFAAVAHAQKPDDSDLRKEVEKLKTQLQSVQSELDQIKATLHEQSARSNPIVDVGADPQKGSAAAQLVVIEFSDFECPFCLEYVKTTYNKVMEDYVKTGKVRYVFADFPGEKIHPHSFHAAEAGRCGNEQGKFWEMHDQLFARQRDFATTGFADAARAAGLNTAQFESCLSGGKYAAAVRQSMEANGKLGIQGTPTFVIGTADPDDPSKVKLARALVGAQPFSAFQQTIDSLLPK